jgi:hypothetical protein
MARFMDFHEDLELPAEAIAQLAQDTRNARADQFGRAPDRAVPQRRRQGVLLLDGPDEEAIRQHHAASRVPCGDVQHVEPHLTSENRDPALGHDDSGGH